MRTLLSSLVCLLMATGSAAAQPAERRLVDEAAAALGGRERILAVRTLVLEGAGENFNLGQNKSPDAPLPTLAVTEYVRKLDLANGRIRLEQLRTPKYVTSQSASRQIFGLDGSVAFNVAPNGDASRQPEPVAAERRAELRHHPIALLQAALQRDAQLSGYRSEGGREMVDITTEEGPFTLHVDAKTKQPVRVSSRSHNANLGDVVLATEFGEYQAVDGLQVPGVLTSRVDDHVVARIRLSQTGVNADVGDLGAPAAVSVAAAAPGGAPNVTVEEVAPGVWFLAGGSHHSVLVEFADHLTLVEVPQNDARARAVIAKAKEVRPGKPLTQAVVTHHHFDHSGGFRAAVAEGLEILAHGSSRSFYEAMAKRPFTLEPDALSMSARMLRFTGVDQELVVKDAERTLVLYPISGSEHADTLLMAYLPNERLLVQADVYSPPLPNAPPPAAYPFAANLLENIRSRELNVERIVPIHGRIVPFSDLEQAAAGGRTQ